MVATYRTDPNVTPDALRRKRELAELMYANSMKPRKIEHWTQGTAQLMEALIGGYQANRADKREGELRKAGAATGAKSLAALLAGSGGQTPAPITPPGANPAAPTASAAGPDMTAWEPPPPIPFGDETRLSQDFSGSLIPNADVTAADRDIGARTIIGEANTQAPVGKEAIAHVLLNRKKQNPGMSYSDVALAPNQFEPWNKRTDELMGIDPLSPEYAAAYAAQNKALYGGGTDPTGGADHFYAPKAQASLGRDTPEWAQGEQGTDIGDHRFYQLGYGGKPTQVASNEPMRLGPKEPGAPQGAASAPQHQQLAQALDPALFEAISDPWVPEAYQGIIGKLITDKVTPKDPIKLGEGEQLLDPNTYQPVTSGAPKTTSDINNYKFYAKQEQDAGRQPMSWMEYQNATASGMSLTTNPDGTVSFSQGKGGKPLTEGQSKDMVFVTRASGALPILDQYGNSLTNLGEDLAGGIPKVGNYLKSPEYQKAEGAGKEFLQALLRKDTGATIQPFEIEEYGSVYLPRPGDKPEFLEQKKAARVRALKAIRLGLPPHAILALEKAGVELPEAGGSTDAITSPGSGATTFASEAEAEAAEQAGTLKKGTKVIINGVSGTWN